MARRRPDRLLLRLFYTTLIILALMHPTAVGQLANLTVSLLLAITQGAADAAAANPGAAVLTGLALYVAHQIHTNRPRTARTHART